MKCIYKINDFKPRAFNRPLVTWGIFDGVHRGHQKIIQELVFEAMRRKGMPSVITFRNHPRQTLTQKKIPEITSLEHRLLIFQRLGVQQVLTLSFTPTFSKVSAEDFVKRILINRLKIYGIVIGQQVRFGRNRRGNIGLLKKLCQTYHLYLKICPPVKYHDKIISSTLVRETIKRGKLEEAASMLGHPVSLLGTVVKGSGRGKRLGFPTANLNPHHELIPPAGVYTSKVNIGNRSFNALTNIGVRPTFARSARSSRKIIVETHFLGFNKDYYRTLYGRVLEVEILSKIRAEKRFRDPTELITQIQHDRERYLAQLSGINNRNILDNKRLP